jgi:endonuclease YncB( thermonuclease family)
MSIQTAWNFVVMRCCSNEVQNNEVQNNEAQNNAAQNNAETNHVETNNAETSHVENELNDATMTTPIFSLDGMDFKAKIVDVHDGDTVKAVFKVFDKYYKWNCRIAHVDTPELRTDDPAEKARGIFVRDKLREQILNKIVTLHCLKFDKYGRLLVEINSGQINSGQNNSGQNIHEWLIQNKYANPYEGKTKIKYVK